MPHRSVHLIGSIPASSDEEAMKWALSRAASALRSLPDGETGLRDRWVVHIVESLRNHPDLEVRTEGDWSDYRRTLSFRVRKGHVLRGASLDPGHVGDFERNFPVFRRLAAEHGRPDLTFQVGLPVDLDLALFSLGPVGAIRHRKAFAEATVREITEIHRRAGDGVLFQLEAPVELIFAGKAPRLLRPVVCRWLARGIHALVGAGPAGARFGVHLCLGDLNHEALGRMRDAAPFVAFANVLANGWPAGRSLEYVHAPLARGSVPPPAEPRFYRPLADLALPPGTRFVAGIVHEAQSLAEQQRVLSMIESRLGHDVDVAAACGLGRRDPDTAALLLDRSLRLAGVPEVQPGN